MSQSFLLAGAPVPLEAERHILALADYWGPEAEVVPLLLFRTPSLGPPAVRGHLERLKELLSSAQYDELRSEIADRARFPTVEARLAERARQLAAAATREREARLAEERDALAARERAQREHEAALRLAAALRQLEPAISQRPWSVTDGLLESLSDPSERGPLVERVRAEVMSWFVERENQGSLELPDDAQIDVVRTCDANVLVRARAGSGKTRALIYRALFLVEWGGCSPEEILLVAFNRKAAEEIGRRLEAAGAKFPHVMTLHAFARSIVGATKEIVTDADEDDRPGAIDTVTNDIVSRMTADRALGPQIRKLMLSIAKGVLTEFELKGLERDAHNGLSWRRSLAIETLDGTRTRSFAEKRVLDFLFEHDLVYRYRKTHWLRGEAVRPLVTLSGEHARVVVDTEGDLSIDAIKTLEDKKFTVLGLPPSDGKAIELAYAQWAKILNDAGVTARRIDKDGVWERLRERARRKFNRLIKQYIGRMRQQGLTSEERTRLLSQHRPAHEDERLFLELAERAHSEYLAILARDGTTDFSAVVSDATRAINEGRRTWRRRGVAGDIRRLKHVMVDEFQDVSPVLMSLIEVVRKANAGIRVTGIGDDWQAINGFAGASARFFTQFDDHFPEAVTRTLPTNYRSRRDIVEVGNVIMSDQGVPAIANSSMDAVLQRGDLSTLQLTPLEQDDSPMSRLLPAVRRLVASALRAEETIAVLSRMRSPVPEQMLQEGDGGWEGAVHAGLSTAEKRRVLVSTVHQFKGREADTVILVDGSNASFPLIHPTWSLFRIFGDSIQSIVEEERRLLYVAVTRAAKRLICLIDSDRETDYSFLFNRSIAAFQPLRWSEFPPVNVRADDKCVVTVGNINTTAAEGEGTFAIKELLSQAGFRYAREPVPHWAAVLRIAEHGLAELIRELQEAAWAVKGRALLVEIEQGNEEPKLRFLVSEGRWVAY